jgi:hypothetical protein
MLPAFSASMCCHERPRDIRPAGAIVARSGAIFERSSRRGFDKSRFFASELLMARRNTQHASRMDPQRLHDQY